MSEVGARDDVTFDIMCRSAEALRMSFDWHAQPINRSTTVIPSYRSTQNVRRFLKRECGEDFAFDRAFVAWIKDGAPKTMGDVADEWLRRKRGGA